MPDHTDPEWLREAYEDMSQREMAEAADVSHMTINYHMKKHGIEAPNCIPEERLRDDLLHVADELGKTPGYEEYDDLGNYSSITVARVLGDGSWNDALVSVNLQPNMMMNINTCDIREDLIRVANKLGRAPGYREYDEHGKYSYETVVNAVGDGFWVEALRSVDLWPIEYGGVAMRSSYEPVVAQRLDELGVDWEYEPEQLQTDAGGYTPDFILADNTIVEVKGMPRPRNKAPKLEELMQDRRVVVVGTEWWRDRLPCDEFVLYDDAGSFEP